MRRPVTDTEAWLLDPLAAGPVLRDAIVAEAEAQDIASERTLYRIKARHDIRHGRYPPFQPNAPYYWWLPDREPAADEPAAIDDAPAYRAAVAGYSASLDLLADLRVAPGRPRSAECRTWLRRRGGAPGGLGADARRGQKPDRGNPRRIVALIWHRVAVEIHRDDE